MNGWKVTRIGSRNTWYGVSRMGFQDFKIYNGLGKVCQDCQERHLACHDTCEKYQSVKESFEEYKEKIKAAKKKEQIIDSFKKEMVDKSRRVGHKDNFSNHYAHKR